METRASRTVIRKTAFASFSQRREGDVVPLGGSSGRDGARPSHSIATDDMRQTTRHIGLVGLAVSSFIRHSFILISSLPPLAARFSAGGFAARHYIARRSYRQLDMVETIEKWYNLRCYGKEIQWSYDGWDLGFTFPVARYESGGTLSSPHDTM